METILEDDFISQIDSEYQKELENEENTVEALLFVMGGSVGEDDLIRALGTGRDAAVKAAERLKKKYEERNSGILIKKLEDRYQMLSNPLYNQNLIKVISKPKKPVLTDVILETLAIICYRQPVTKAEIEDIRGVKSDHAVNRLIEYGLIYESGRLDQPGRPALFKTSEEFLKTFGLESLSDLPDLPEAIKKIDDEMDSDASEETDLFKENVAERTDDETEGAEDETEGAEDETEGTGESLEQEELCK